MTQAIALPEVEQRDPVRDAELARARAILASHRSTLASMSSQQLNDIARSDPDDSVQVGTDRIR